MIGFRVLSLRCLGLNRVESVHLIGGNSYLSNELAMPSTQRQYGGIPSRVRTSEIRIALRVYRPRHASPLPQLRFHSALFSHRHRTKTQT